MYVNSINNSFTLDMLSRFGCGIYPIVLLVDHLSPCARHVIVVCDVIEDVYLIVDNVYHFTDVESVVRPIVWVVRVTQSDIVAQPELVHIVVHG